MLLNEERRWNSRLGCWDYIDKDGLLHRDGDKPARVCTPTRGNLENPDVYYLKHGKKHREKNKPAVILGNGCKEWWVNGKFIKNKDCGKSYWV